jgi:hypothetical protein
MKKISTQIFPAAQISIHVRFWARRPEILAPHGNTDWPKFHSLFADQPVGEGGGAGDPLALHRVAVAVEGLCRPRSGRWCIGRRPRVAGAVDRRLRT